MVVLPTPGPPVITSVFGREREPDRGHLALGENKPDPTLDPCQGLVWIDPRPRELTVGKLNQALSDDALGPMQAC